MVFFVSGASLLLFSDAVLSRMTLEAAGAGTGAGLTDRYQAVIPAQQIGKWRTVRPVAGNTHDDGAAPITVRGRIACRAV